MKKINSIIIIGIILTASCPFVSGLSLKKDISVEKDDKIFASFYVDDDAPPEWYDETHFKYIMDAVNASADGDTIFVFNGTYYEYVDITKSIKLIGEEKYNTIIDGTYIESTIIGSQILSIFRANNVTVSGFTIQNFIDSPNPNAAIYVSSSNYDNISNNIIKDINAKAILIANSKYILISNNIFMNCHFGIDYEHDNKNTYSTITKNVFTDTTFYAIFLVGANKNIISHNNITATWNVAIWLYSSHNNLIKRNNIQHNENGIILALSSRNKIYENNFIDCSSIGRHATYKGWSFFNRFKGNYWDNNLIFKRSPKLLVGRFGLLPIPFFKFDLRPASKPYDIDIYVVNIPEI